jgi:replication factor C subunit 1
MFTSIYRPKNIDNFIGNKNIIKSFIQWLLEWEPTSKKNKCALISGITGIGKTLLVELILKKHDYNIINLALDIDRDKDYMNNVIKHIINNKKTFDGQENVLVVSEVDVGSDYGFISCLLETIKETNIPIICICENRYEQSIKPILNYCLDFKMIKPSYNEVYALLYNVVIKEKIKIKETELKELYEQANGDIRFILNTLQFGLRNSKKNIDSSNIFETTGKLLSMDETLESKYKIYWSSNDLHSLMIHENYINNTFCIQDQRRKMENLYYSAHALSDMDLFQTQVNTINWELEPHVALSIIKATTKCNKKTMIKFPQFLARTSTMNKNMREKLNYDNVKFLEQEIKEAKEEAKRISRPRGRPKKSK